MVKNMDELLKKALAPTRQPSAGINEKVLCQVKERENMARNRKKSVVAAGLAAACILAVGSVTAAAAYRYLSPKEVAKEFQNDKLAEAFQGKDALLVNETMECGEYQVTLLGSAAGKRISNYLPQDDAGNVEEDKIYTVVAIKRTDGEPMPETSSDEYGKEPFFVSHYIRGLNPAFYSVMSMGGGYSEMVRDGVQYRILEMDNIEMFADRGIYVGVSSGTFYDNGAYLYNEETGEMKRNEDYEGVNALFVLPVDKSKADPAAAEKYLQEMEEEDEEETADPSDGESAEVKEFLAMLTPENIDQYAEPIESTRQVCVPDEEGLFEFSYETDGESGSGTDNVEYAFKDKTPGVRNIGSFISYSESIETLLIPVYTMNEDGTVTVVIYRPKEK